MALVEIVNRTQRAKGVSDTATLQTAFPATPSISGYDNGKVSEVMTLLHDGVVVDNLDFPNQSLDYEGKDSDVPFVAADVQTGVGGLPWTAYTPNIVSPGENSINPTDIAAVPPGTPASSGMGSQLLPGDTTTQIASQEKAGTGPGNLTKGHSGATQ